MSNAAIRAQLETAVITWAAAQDPVITVAKENSAFNKPTSGRFLEMFLLPSTTINPNVNGGRKRMIGIFQVNCWGQSGSGPMSVESLAQSIIDLFPLVPKTGAVSIENTPSAERAIIDVSGWYIIPVTIKYRYEAS